MQTRRGVPHRDYDPVQQSAEQDRPDFHPDPATLHQRAGHHHQPGGQGGHMVTTVRVMVTRVMLSIVCIVITVNVVKILNMSIMVTWVIRVGIRVIKAIRVIKVIKVIVLIMLIKLILLVHLFFLSEQIFT